MPIIIEGEGRVPTIEDVAIARNQVCFRTQFLAPETLEIVKERESEGKERQRKFRDDSELLQPRQADTLGQLHKSSGSRNGKGLFQKTIAAEVRHEHPKKSSWGKRRQQLADKAQEYFINRALADAENEDRKR